MAEGVDVCGLVSGRASLSPGWQAGSGWSADAPARCAALQLLAPHAVLLKTATLSSAAAARRCCCSAVAAFQSEDHSSPRHTTRHREEQRETNNQLMRLASISLAH